MTYRSSSALFALSILLASCGGWAIDPNFPQNDASQWAAVVARLERAPEPTDRPLAVGAGTHDLYAVDLTSGSAIWSLAADVTRGPFIAGDLVVTQEGTAGNVVARRASTGEQVLTLSARCGELVGAAGEGPDAVIACGAHALLVHEGRVTYDRSFESRRYSGTIEAPPVARAGLFFVAASPRRVAALDAASGNEVAELLAPEYGLDVRMDGSVLVVAAPFGRDEVGVSRDGARESYRSSSLSRPFGDAWERWAIAPPGGHSRLLRHRTRAGIAGNIVYTVAFRALFANDSEDDRVRWAYVHPTDIVGADSSARGVLIADAAGGLTWIDPAGRAQPTMDTGHSPSFVALRLDRSQSTSIAVVPDADHAGLLRVAGCCTEDPRMLPVRRYALERLDHELHIADAEGLQAICTMSAPVDVELRDRACRMLRGLETDDARVLRELAGRDPWSVTNAASLAARLREARAVPELEHALSDREASPAELQAVVSALGTFGDPSAAGPLSDLLGRHCDRDPEIESALATAARVLIEIGGPSERERVRAVMGNACTSPALRASFESALRAAGPSLRVE